MAIHSHLQLQQFQMTTAGTGCGDGGNQAPPMLFQQTVKPLAVFSEPESELTCYVSGSRKRIREETSILPTGGSSALLHQQQRRFLWQKRETLLLREIQGQTTQTTADLAVESSRLIQSAVTSTSGRPPLATASASVAEPSTVTPVYNNNNNVSGGISFSPGLISMLHYHNLEVDTLIRLHAEKLRSGLQEARKRQCRAVVAAMEQQAQSRVAEKQAELDAITKKNAELEDRLRQAVAESHAWFNVAENSEALVAGLRASLEEALLQKLGCADEDGDDDKNGHRGGARGLDLPAATPEEGYGDSEEEAPISTTAVSCSGWRPEASSSVVPAARNNAPAVGVCSFRCNSFRCKSCGQADACVLVVPCRHLCLCLSCEPSVHECPVCRGRKNDSLQIYVS